jgi:hypothetical protein
MEEVKRLANPLDGAMWKCSPISEEEVWEARRAGAVEDRCWNDVVHTLNEQESRDFHIKRVATLMGVSDLGLMILMLDNHQAPVVAKFNDGNHRFAAAIVRGDLIVRLLIAASVEADIPLHLPSARPISQATPRPSTSIADSGPSENCRSDFLQHPIKGR